MINKNNEEIDLFDLIRKISISIDKILRAIGNAVMISIVFLIRNWLPLGFSLVLGVGVSYAMKYIRKPGFSSEMVLKTNAVPAEEMISYLNKLHTFCTEENYSALAISLELTDQSVRLIDDIRTYWVIDKNIDKTPDYVDYYNKFDVYDTNNIRMPDRLAIVIKTKSRNEFANIKNGIIHFIKSDSLFNQKNRIRNQQNIDIMNRLNYDIIQLDSLQKVKIFEETRNKIPGKDNQIVFLQEQKTQLVYTDIHDLYARKQIYEAQIELYKDLVTVISDLTIPNKPYTRARYYAVYVIPLFFGLMLLSLIIYKNRSSIKLIFDKF